MAGETTTDLGLSPSAFGPRDDIQPDFETPPGLTPQVVEQVSYQKDEPAWMRRFRLESLAIFEKLPVPSWGADLSGVDFGRMRYYVRPPGGRARTWDDVPESIKQTFERLGLPAAERRFLAGVGVQYDSEFIYRGISAELEEQGVIFLDMGSALREHPDMVRRYFGTVVPPRSNKLAALNSAAWSGGSFIYVPAGVRVEQPLHGYFRLNADNLGQLQRTLIVVEPGAYLNYVAGCSAPRGAVGSMQAGVVEVIVKPGARCRYTTIQNLSTDVYNLDTSRAVAHRDATMEWVDGNLGSKITMKYPSVRLAEPGARAEALSIAFAGQGQHHDAGAKMVHAAPHTSSLITSKSISTEGGRSGYRGHVQVLPGAIGATSNVQCDALLLDGRSRSDTYPYMDVEESEVAIQHEATVSRVGEEQLFYLMSRGLSADQAMALCVSGFIEPIAKELPLEYALALNRLIALQLEGSIG